MSTWNKKLQKKQAIKLLDLLEISFKKNHYHVIYRENKTNLWVSEHKAKLNEEAIWENAIWLKIEPFFLGLDEDNTFSVVADGNITDSFHDIFIQTCDDFAKTLK